MENDTIQQQSVGLVTGPQEMAPKPKFGLSKTIIVIIILALMLLAGVGVYIYQHRAKPVTNTGAVSSEATPAPNDPYVEYGKLLDLGNFAGDGFSVASVSASTDIAVFLDKPYDQNQTKFEAWLTANGYGDIPKEKVIYFHQP